MEIYPGEATHVILLQPPPPPKMERLHRPPTAFLQAVLQCELPTHRELGKKGGGVSPARTELVPAFPQRPCPVQPVALMFHRSGSRDLVLFLWCPEQMNARGKIRISQGPVPAFLCDMSLGPHSPASSDTVVCDP